MNSGDTSHHTLEEKRWEKFEVIEGIGVLLRLRLKDKTPPCIIRFSPEDRRRDIYKVYQSYDLREPDENVNHGSETNVSSLRLHEILRNH